MDKQDFLNMFGFKTGDTVKIKAVELQMFIQESTAKDETITELNTMNEELSNTNTYLVEENEQLKLKLEKALDHNDDLYSTSMRNHNRLREMENIIDDTNKRLSKALHKAKDADSLKDKLMLSNALNEYRRNQQNIDRLIDTIEVSLY